MNDRLLGMSMSRGVSNLLNVAVELDIARYLADGPEDAFSLSIVTNTNSLALYRVLRALANLGVFQEENGMFSLTSISESLLIPERRAAVLWATGKVVSESLDNLLYSVKTGKSGFEKAFGDTFFNWLEEHPKESKLFNDAMIGQFGAEHDAVLDAYNFSEATSIIDVGGGTGSFAKKIAAKYPGTRVTLFDKPDIVFDVIDLVPIYNFFIRFGNFFSSVPRDGDIYILSQILHDWNDRDCVTILNNCHRAMEEGSKLLVIERVVYDTPKNAAKAMDVAMLVLTDGMERTAQEYHDLLKASGFRVTEVISTKGTVTVIEAMKEKF